MSLKSCEVPLKNQLVSPYSVSGTGSPSVRYRFSDTGSHTPL